MCSDLGFLECNNLIYHIIHVYLFSLIYWLSILHDIQQRLRLYPVSEICYPRLKGCGKSKVETICFIYWFVYVLCNIASVWGGING